MQIAFQSVLMLLTKTSSALDRAHVPPTIDI